MSSYHSRLADKIKGFEEIREIVRKLKKEHRQIVFTNGCFDILHPGHVDYLQRASDMGDVLIVGLNTDSSVKRLKGEGRPLQNEDSRAIVLAGLEAVSYVVLFDEDTPLKLIEAILPDVLVKGGDYQIEKIVGYTEVTRHGGRVLTLPFVEGCSTTSIIASVAKRQPL